MWYTPFLIVFKVVFLLYSSFHFGESELQRLGEKLHTLKASLKGTLVGALILFIVVIGHWQESILLLKNINGLWPENILKIQVLLHLLMI